MAWKQWRGEEAKRLRHLAELAALRTAATEILNESKTQVPLLDGDLRDSGRIERSRAKVATVRIVFGGPKAPYAVKMHEVPFKFKRGRKRRYLADPFNSIAPRAVPQQMLVEMQRHFPGRGR